VAASGFEELANPGQISPEGDRRRGRIESDQSYQFRKIILEAFMKRVNPRVAPSYRPQKFNSDRIIQGIIGGNLPIIMNNICTFKKPTSKLSRAKKKIANVAYAATKKMRGKSKSNVACAAGGVCSDISSYFKCDTEMLKKIIDIAELIYSIKMRALIASVLIIRTNRITGIQRIAGIRRDITTMEHENIISQSLSFIFYTIDQRRAIGNMVEATEMELEADRLQAIIDTDTDTAIRARINRLMEGIPQPLPNEELVRRIRDLHTFTQRPTGRGVSKKKRKMKKGRGKKSIKKKK